MQLKFLSYTYPGLEWILKQEILNKKWQLAEIWPGFVSYFWNESVLVKANLWLRTANKVYIVLDEFTTNNFDELFDKIYEFDWKFWIWNKFKFFVKPHIVKSGFSQVWIQKIVQKAIIKKLVGSWNYVSTTWTNLEIRVDIFKNNFKILLDTSGDPLYKRGYKVGNSQASIKETLAAGIILLSGCKQDVCYDPFCGSWTLLIEKALIDLNIAPGSFRKFVFEEFDWIDKNLVQKERRRASTRRKDKSIKLYGYDIDERMVNIARQNIENAWLIDYIVVQQWDFLNLKISDCMITNPPYGERIKSKNIEKIYDKLFKDLKNLKCGWIITGYKVDKKFLDNFKVRVLSNGGKRVRFLWRK